MVRMLPFDNELPRPGPPEEIMVCMVPFDYAFPRPRPPEEMMVCTVPFDNEFPRCRLHKVAFSCEYDRRLYAQSVVSPKRVTHDLI